VSSKGIASAWGTIWVILEASCVLNYSDLSSPELFSICARGGDAASWEEFIRRFNPVIGRSVLRVAMRYGTADKALVDDLVQEAYLKICSNECKVLRSFIPHNQESAFAFLKVVAASVAQDFFKSRFAGKRAPEATASSMDQSVEPTAKSSQNALNHLEREVLVDQIDRYLRAVVPASDLQRSRTVFWLYYRSGLTASAIAALPALELTTKGVESLLFRLTRLVRQNVSSARTLSARTKKGIEQSESF
jgi:RNA polymerase sigma-70 factor, ECF subfamily